MKFFNKFLLSTLAVAAIATTGCKKEYLDTTPSTEIADSDLFKTTTSAYTLLHGIHRLNVSAGAGGQTNPLDFGLPGLYLCQDIMGQDIIVTNSNYDWAIFHYQYVATEGANYWMPYNYWSYLYQMINNANHLIKNIDNVQGNETDKLDIKGQALAYRAMAYFYLVNMFSHHYNAGDLNAPGVPLYTLPTEANTEHKGRGTIGQVYDQILKDISEAVSTLESSGKTHTDKSMISLSTARGLYARIALTVKDWPTAANQAELAKEAFPLASTESLSNGFNSQSNSEWMWSSNLTAEQYNARGLRNFMGWMDDEGTGYAEIGTVRFITKDLYDKVDPKDVRKKWWNATSRQQNKFRFANKSSVEFNDLLMRSPEMYLIEAEARYQMNDVTSAKNLLETLVQSRYVDTPNYVAPSGPALLEEIYTQRRIELWAEGQAYFDITRLQRGLNRVTGTGNHQRSVTGGVLTLPKNDPKFLFKIPQREIDANQAIEPNEQN